MINTPTTIENLWSIFRDRLLTSVESYVPSKMSRSKHYLPWVNRKLQKSLKKKARMYKQAKKTGGWSQ